MDQRNNIPKVPSCAKCNNVKSQLEHYLLSVLPFGATHQDAHRALLEDVTKRLAKNKKLHRKINEGFGYTYIPVKTNMIERRLSLSIDSDVLHEFIGFVGRGLMWHHWKKYLPLSCSYKVFTPSYSGIEFVDGLFHLSTNLRVNVQLGNETVRYKGVMSEIDDGVSVWAVQMLGGITLADKNQNNIFKNSFVTMVTGTPETLETLKLRGATSYPSQTDHGFSL